MNPSILILIFASLAVCCVILYIATRDLPRLFWLAKYGRRTKGRIVRDHTILAKGGMMHFPVVHFTDDTGFIHEFQSRYQKESTLRDQMTDVTVVYDPKTPGQKAEIFEARHFYPSIAGVVIFIGIAVGAPIFLLVFSWH